MVPRKEIPSSNRLPYPRLAAPHLSILRKKRHKHSSTPPEPSPPLLKLGPGAEYVACLPKPSEGQGPRTHDIQSRARSIRYFSSLGGVDGEQCIRTIHKLSSLQLDSAESLAHKFQIHTVEGTHLPSSSLPFPALRLAPDSERYAAYRTLKRRRVVAIGSKPDLASEVASCCRWALRYRANALKYLYG